MICTPPKCFLGDQIEKNEMGHVARMGEGEERRTQVSGRKT